MPERLVIIGGDAAGMSAASNARRGRPDLEIVALERGGRTSYSACGIPYLVAGDIADPEQLVARTPQEFRDNQRIDVRLHHEATAIDLDARKVEVRDHIHDRTLQLGFDELVVATGAVPRRPQLPGIDLPFVVGVQTVDDGEALLEHARRIACRKVVVVGGGYIGLEMAEAFVRWGASVTMLEAGPQVMSTLDPDMAEPVAAALRGFGVEVRTDTRVHGFEPGRVLLDDSYVDADLVVLGMGVSPNTELAGAAGIELGAKEAVAVDRRQHTRSEGVWSAGDCAESRHLVSGRQVHVALGTVANKQGRVAGINLGGGYATFPGVVGTAITKVCHTEVARTGLGAREADAAGFGWVAARIDTTSVAGYFPSAGPVCVKLLAERVTGRLLGGQIVGAPGSAKRIDTLATALTAGMSVFDLVDLDLAYAPPFSSVWDLVQVAARRAAAEVVADRA
jgi:NADPH-dependent 2,4-dienoyl-CoA reductase/sulfur reductase-like enzyme